MKVIDLSWQFSIAIIVFMLSTATSLSSAAEVVYDNTSNPVKSAGEDPYLTDGFLPFNFFFANEPMGDRITLENTARTIIEFDLLLSSTQEVTLSNLKLSFHDTIVDNGIYWPGGKLWTGELTNVVVNGLTTVTFAVPAVVVPDSFVWTAAADSSIAGIATFDQPTVGTSSTYDLYWDEYSPGNWMPLNFEGDPPANFGAKVTAAVPEPVTSILLALSGLSLVHRKRN